MTVKSTQYVLFYDLRQWVQSGPQDWTIERRRQYLYRESVNQPISVDRYVLDSFDSLYSEDEMPGYTGPFSPFWESLADLNQFISVKNIDLNKFLLLAFSIDVSLFSEDDVTHWNKILGSKSTSVEKENLFSGLASPSNVQENWNFIGYDVADSGFMSSISNIGFTPADDVEKLRKTWSGLLNNYHLFDDADEAVKFKQLSDKRVPRHAPFTVIGIWCLNEKCGDEIKNSSVI